MAFPNPTDTGYQNFFSALTTADCTAIDTDIFLDTIPDATSGFLVIDPFNAANREVIWYNSKTSAKVSCSSAADGRGYDGSTAKSHTAGTYVIMAPIAAMLEGLAAGYLSTDPARLYSQPHYDYTNKFVVSGGVVTATTGLGYQITEATAYYNGRKYTLAATSGTVSASTTSYVGILFTESTGTAGIFTTTGSTAAASTRLTLARIVSGASTITSISQSGIADFGAGLVIPVYPVLKGMDYPAWRAYTPTLTNITLGNGTLVARYKRTGNTVDVYCRFTLGSTSAIGTQPKVSLPIAAQGGTYITSSVVNPLGRVVLLDNGTVSYEGPAGTTDNTTVTLFVNGVAGTYASLENITATVPMTWTTGDAFAFTIRYECDNV